MKGLEEAKAIQNGIIIQRLIIERRTTNDNRQKEINKELTSRYNQQHIYI